MKLKINAVRVVDREHETVLEWFVITERFFNFVSWLLILGVLSALYNKTHNILILIIEFVLLILITKLIAKAILFVIRITIDFGETNVKLSKFVWDTTYNNCNFANIICF